MKPRISSPQRGGASLLDLIVMLIAVAAVALVGFAYMHRSRRQSQWINCVINLKQIGLSYRLWSGDNGEEYPANVSTNTGGTMELVADGFAFPDFLVMSNELGTPKILVCPEDKRRTYAANFGMLKSDANLSYFTSPGADESRPKLWLSGDRNLATNLVALKPGPFTLPTNRVMSWTTQIHKYGGNICFADGSVQQFASSRLQKSATTNLSIWLATTNAPFRLVIP